MAVEDRKSAGEIVRRLIVVPIVHTSADLGSLAEAVRAHHERQGGLSAWERREQTVEQLWRAIPRKIDALGLDYGLVLLYQDGLPVCDHELEIVRELAAAGSLNHQLLLELIGRGATLMGTEDPQLLIREYHLHRRQLGNAAGQGSQPGEAAELLDLRDRAIARRIAETLGPEQVGLLFLGAAHSCDALRAAGLAVEPLF